MSEIDRLEEITKELREMKEILKSIDSKLSRN